MAEPHVITALVRKRAELAGEIELAHQRLRAMVLDLENLDRTLLIFDPDYRIDTIKPKAVRPPEDWSKRGQMTRLILDIMRRAEGSLTTRDVTLALLAERGMDVGDINLFRLMRQRVACALRGQRDKGVIRSVEGPGQYMNWELAR